jgi:diguanylate cyclase (GGDEF)-like protein
MRLSGGIFAFTADERRELVTSDERVMEMFGCKTSADFNRLTNNTFDGMIAPADREATIAAITAEGGEGYKPFNDITYHIHTLDGEEPKVRSYGRLSDDPGLGRIFFVATAMLSSDEKIILHPEGVDPLTRLMMMPKFLDRMADEMQMNDGAFQAVVYFNLTNFKIFNAKYGSEQGDLLLCDFAHALRNSFSGDLVSRLAQDHFAVYTTNSRVISIVSSICEAFRQVDDAREVQVKAGIRYINRRERVKPRILCDEAKMASDAIKERADLSYSEYQDSLSQEMTRSAYIAARLDDAIKYGDIEVYYQPIIRSITGKLCGFEALSRWRDPRYGEIKPDVFIRALENSHVIDKLDRAVVGMVCRDIRAQIDEGAQVVPVSFNLSRLDFQMGSPLETINDIAAEYDISPDLLRIEVTESAFVGNEEVVGKEVKRLRRAGYQVWMDDFGSGYSSLGMLKNHMFDTIKLDASLVDALNERGRSVLISTTEMIKSLKSCTLAEGVETQEQVEFLRGIGCEYLQGYYFKRPMSRQDCINYLKGRQGICETTDDTKVFSKVGRLDMTRGKQYALLWDDGKSLHIPYSYNAFTDIIQYAMEMDDVQDETATDRLLSKYRDELHHLLHASFSSGNAETEVFSEHGHWLSLTVSPLAQSGESKVCKLTVSIFDDGHASHYDDESGFLESSDISDSKGTEPSDNGNAAETSTTASSLSANNFAVADKVLLDTLMRSCVDVYLLDFDADTATYIMFDGEYVSDATPVKGVVQFLEEYTQRYIYPDDRARMQVGLSEAALFGGQRIKRKQKTTQYRRRRENGQFELCEATVAALAHSSSRQVIVSMKHLAIPRFASPGEEDRAEEPFDPMRDPRKLITQYSDPSLSVESTKLLDARFCYTVIAALNEPDVEAGIQLFIESAGGVFRGDHTYVVAENGDGSFSMTYEWCDNGFFPVQNIMQGVRFSDLSIFNSEIADHQMLVATDIEDLRKVAPDFYELLRSYGVHSVALVPLMVNNRRVGYFGIDNASKRILSTEHVVLMVSARFISVMINKRNIIEHLDYLSLRDDLTGILNRRGLQKYVRTLRPGLRLVLVYGDINDLKAVNDSHGHDAGDALIKRTGELMLSVAGRGHVFRIGGDEFAMTFELEEGDDAGEPLRRVRRAFEEEGISIALGYGETRTPLANADLLVSVADKHMYQDKVSMHASRDAASRRGSGA